MGDQATKLVLVVGVCTVCLTVDARGFVMLGKVYVLLPWDVGDVNLYDAWRYACIYLRCVRLVSFQDQIAGCVCQANNAVSLNAVLVMLSLPKSHMLHEN